MNAGRLHGSSCPTDETLAAFVDGRLDGAAKQGVEAHLDLCADCRETWMMATETPDEQTQAPGMAAAAPPRAPRRWRPVAAGLAAVAAVLLAVIVVPQWWRDASRSPFDELVSAVGDRRATQGRLSGGFAWGEVPAPARGGDGAADVPEVQIAAGRIAQALRDDRTPRALARQGSAFLIVGRVDDAVGALEEATGAPDAEAAWWSDLAVAYLERADRLGRAADVPRALEAASRALEANPDLPEAVFNRALALERLGLYPEAIEAWQRYLELDAESGWATEARAALARLEEQVAGARHPVDAQSLRERLFDVTIPAWAVASGDEAAARLREARHLAAEIERLAPADTLATDVVGALAPPVEGYIAYGRGKAAYVRNDFAAAADALGSAAAALRRGRNPLEFVARRYLAIIDYRRKGPRAALPDLQRLRDVIATRPYPGLQGLLDSTLGLFATHEGRHADAISFYDRGERLLVLAGESRNAAFVAGQRAFEFHLLGNDVRGWDVSLRALAGTDREGILLAAAETALNQQMPRVAEQFQRAAISRIRDLEGRRPSLIDASIRLARSLEARGETAQARATLAEARASLEFAPPAVAEALAAVLAPEEADLDLDPRRAIGTVTRALAYYDSRGSSQTLSDLLVVRAGLHRKVGNVEAARADLAAAHQSFDRVWSLLETPVSRATIGDTRRRMAEEAVELAVATNAPEAGFAGIERLLGRDVVFALAGGTPPFVDIDALRTWLPAGVVIATYFIGQERSVVWTVRRDAMSFTQLDADATQLERLASRVSAASLEDDAGGRLRALLIDPLDLRPDELLVVVPDGPLAVVPFAGLPRDGRYLVEDHPIIVSPSATAFRLLTERATARSQANAAPERVLAIGAPTINRTAYPDLAELPGALDEARAVAAIYGAGARLMTGDAATREAILDGFGRSRLVHFAGHALAVNAAPMQSRLVVADASGRDLTADDIAGFRTSDLGLVVLAACHGTGGFVTRSQGPLGIARAFLSSGVPSVVASHRAVSDRFSTELLLDFHRQYARTRDAARALQSAQVAAIRRGSAGARTSHWAWFATLGGMQRPAVGG